MRKVTRLLFSSFVLLMVLATLVSCGETKEPTTEIVPTESTKEETKTPEHTHSYGEMYYKGTTTHWKECSCGEKGDEGSHDFGNWITITEATETTVGSKKQVCSVCNYENIVEIPKKDHTHNYTSVVVNPTCETNGYTKHTCSCGNTYNDTKVNALGHKYENGSCIRCGKVQENDDSKPTIPEEGTKGLIYELAEDESSYIVIGYNGQERNVFIPREYNGLPVVSIGEKSFQRCENIISITISYLQGRV